MFLELVHPDMRAWARASIRQVGRALAPVPSRRARRFIVVHLDGVPRSLLEEEIGLGHMPFLAGLLRSGAYTLSDAFWGSPSSTPAFQAGLLYGIRHPNLPAYQWFDRAWGREVQMNRPKDALAVERRLEERSHDSLLSGGGTAYLSLFRARATNRLTMTSLATVAESTRALVRDLRGIRGVRRRRVLEFIGDVLGEARRVKQDVREWVEKVRDERHEREFRLNQFFIGLAWDFAHTRALVDMARGVPAIYLVFGNYDEVAHRRGPLSAQARQELGRVDSKLLELYALGRSLERSYDLYVLADHGHVDSAPFEQRVGVHLKEYLTGGPVPDLGEQIERALLDGRPGLPREEGGFTDPIVIEAGNFAHVYLARGGRALEAREVLAHHKAVLARAVHRSDIGIVALRRGDAAVAIVQGEVFDADSLARSRLSQEFSVRAVRDLLFELPHMDTAGDLVLFGESIHEGGTVGFAWEFGSHGGLTTTETRSWLCWPNDVPIHMDGLSHAVQLHEKLSDLYRS